MDSVPSKLSSLPFTPISRFACDSSLGAFLTNHLQEISIRNKVEDLILRVDALEERFDSHPNSVVEQRRRSEVVWYATIPLVVPGAERFPASSRRSKGSYRFRQRSPICSKSLTPFKTMELSPDSLKIYGKLSSITRFVRDPRVLSDIDRNN